MPVFLHDKNVIERYLRRDPALHIYELGDLDDFFWPYTCWFAAFEEDQVASLFLLYAGMELPVVLVEAENQQDRARLTALFVSSLGLLPSRFYSHLSPGIVDVLREQYTLESHGLYLRMKLVDESRLEGLDLSHTEQLAADGCAEVADFYNQAYPGNWFDARMLETGCYYGVRRAGRLVSAAGIHVYSPHYGVAAIGNITTLPEYRGQGLGALVTARVCRELLKTVRVVGLNVRADNIPAIRCYHKLGFQKVAEYEEWMVERRK